MTEHGSRWCAGLSVCRPLDREAGATGGPGGTQPRGTANPGSRHELPRPSRTEGGNADGTAAEGGRRGPQKVKTRTASNSMFGHLSPQNENTNSKRYVFPHVQCILSTVAKMWKLPKCPSTEMVKEEVVHIHKGISLSHKKGMESCHLHKMDGPRRCSVR